MILMYIMFCILSCCSVVCREREVRSVWVECEREVVEEVSVCVCMTVSPQPVPDSPHFCYAVYML
jgi:hypothetical protein